MAYGVVDFAEVRMVNKSEEIKSYRISLQHLRMLQDGRYEEIKDGNKAGEKFLDDILLFSPKRITLKPNQMQVIRLAVKRGNDFASGEYRSHMLFQEEPSSEFKPENNIEFKAKNQNFTVTLRPLFGISIPVIITRGSLEAKVEIANINFKNSNNTISFDLLREGNKSEFGDIIILQKTFASEKEIGWLNNLSVFYPYKKRNIVINLSKQLVSGDKVIVKYVKKDNPDQIISQRKIDVQ